MNRRLSADNKIPTGSAKAGYTNENLKVNSNKDCHATSIGHKAYEATGQANITNAYKVAIHFDSDNDLDQSFSKKLDTTTNGLSG